MKRTRRGIRAAKKPCECGYNIKQYFISSRWVKQLGITHVSSLIPMKNSVSYSAIQNDITFPESSGGGCVDEGGGLEPHSDSELSSSSSPSESELEGHLSSRESLHSDYLIIEAVSHPYQVSCILRSVQVILAKLCYWKLAGNSLTMKSSLSTSFHLVATNFQLILSVAVIDTFSIVV